MPATLASILAAADAEWQHWGRSTWDVPANNKRIAHVDDEKDYAQYVIDKYCSVGGGSPTLEAIQTDKYFWSAVGMSAIMKNAGYTRQEFQVSQSHSKFIRQFVKARNDKDASAKFWGFRLDEPGGEPEPGDLVAYARGKTMTRDKAQKLFDSTDRYDSHTDVVVSKQGGFIEVIGCNVKSSVTKKTLSLGPNNHINDEVHHWFAVLKRREV